VIDLPLTAYIPESYVSDLNLRLALYQRLAAADVAQKANGAAPDVASKEDGEEPEVATPTAIVQELERDLTDRFGPPPASVRNLLYAVHLRILARRTGIQSVAREDGTGGRPVITIRSESADLRGRLRHSQQRDLERTGAISVGHQQIRIDLEAAGDTWRNLVLGVMEALTSDQKILVHA
jgi:transcription-repair coupling factor (superfamily II helicase)